MPTLPAVFLAPLVIQQRVVSNRSTNFILQSYLVLIYGLTHSDKCFAQHEGRRPNIANLARFPQIT
ncbi:hypothetical protein PGT21_024703 [Puccinia graminis f. sp. tritici]|uniref:Uncharacterized protein n=1 Tax=Puccinia graminis f. sp. tritici TaxID=56615 RepID=A0A5B0NCY6_PUCGR|nr:hypothetical protein PGT21_024703 [Puccinia graminis f. sp. tritici]